MMTKNGHKKNHNRRKKYVATKDKHKQMKYDQQNLSVSTGPFFNNVSVVLVEFYFTFSTS